MEFGIVRGAMGGGITVATGGTTATPDANLVFDVAPAVLRLKM
jgi:hypothetical protein